MREIKFRVWDPNNEIMHSNIGINKIHLFDFQGDRITEQEGLEIMQYTGLKDRNGKEIYQGDLWLPNGCETPREIVWHMSSWWFQLNGSVTRPIEWTEDGEIIGNVWEDGELLNDRQTTETN